MECTVQEDKETKSKQENETSTWIWEEDVFQITEQGQKLVEMSECILL